MPTSTSFRAGKNTVWNSPGSDVPPRSGSSQAGGCAASGSSKRWVTIVRCPSRQAPNCTPATGQPLLTQMPKSSRSNVVRVSSA